MRLEENLPRFVTVLLASFALSAIAQEQPTRIEIISTFDFPAEGASTFPQKINGAGDIAGEFQTSTQTAGFVRYRDGTFSPPIVDPNDTVFNDTHLRGINDAGLLCGFYLNGDDFGFHGFFLIDDVFTDFVIPGAIHTELYSVNNAADFCGAYSYDAVHLQAFVSISDTIVPISIPGAVTGFSYGMKILTR